MGGAMSFAVFFGPLHNPRDAKQRSAVRQPRFHDYPTQKRMERVTRLELATSSLARRCSTTELHPRFTYEKRPSNKAEKYVCPAILSGIPSGSHENTPERCIPESSRMFIPLFIEWRLLCAVRKRWQGSPPFAADDGSRIGATRARLVKRSA